ncbi:MAG: endopeptidase La [Gammaproteobacteria bacterium]|nr:endopeptidase La [Gammaproteobacteria bacterium]
MDIEQEPVDTPEDERSPGSKLILASESLPQTINLLPLEARPFFPGQAIPLIVNERWEPTIRAVLETEQKIVGVLLLRDNAAAMPVPTDFYRMGTACRLHRVQRADDQLQVLLEGVQRFRIGEWISRKQPYTASVTYFPETRYANAQEIKGYAVAIINTIKELLPLNPLYGEELQVFLQHFNPNEPSQLADFSAAMTTASRKELQEVLETTRILPRLEKVLSLINKELEVARSQMAIRKQVEEEIQGRQREMFLREQLKVIQKELGISKDDRTAELDEFRARISERKVPEHAAKRLEEEMKKLGMLETGSPEYAVTRNYLDWLTSLPWGVYTKDQFDLTRARKVLDRDHEALDDVKQRIVEFLGVGIMRGEISGSILLLVGPPGVGKTSLGRSIAEALDRKFYRFSVGGMRDEAEIKGHRRTYIGAMPGKFIQGIKETGSANPVIMLDEIDKIGASYRGDPASALLEVLDPEQNESFLDHYLDVRFDLSKVLFICTANQLDTIPAPLLDRMEMIRLSGYLTTEKLAIATRHLLPRQMQRAGINKTQLRVDRAALRAIIEGYAREAGVRKLEKKLGAIVRKAVIRLLDKAKTPIKVGKEDVADYLGRPDYRESQRMSGVGIVTGLAWTPRGGDTLAIEATRVHDFSRGFKLTGQLGDVMRESAEIAYSYAIAHADDFNIDNDFFEKAFVHLHVPAGATPKDGPSAGVTMATALLSLASRKRVPVSLAMTGEMTLTGQVLAVGGIREKVVAARRVKIKTIIMPQANEGDFEELPDYVRKGITAHFVSDYTEVAELVFRV